MTISAKIIADSVSPSRVRITSMQLVYPRFIHSELMTHRVFSRNAASSRAIPIQKMIKQVQDTPAMPVEWGKNQAGMQARENLTHEAETLCRMEWIDARDSAVRHAQRMVAYGLHKQIVNRILEPWQLMHTILTATEWTNFFNLRRHPDAQPEIKVLADSMYVAMEESIPMFIDYDEWHLPYVSGKELEDIELAKRLSAARCARVSYLTHDNQTPDPVKDQDLHDKLFSSGHYSPFEHQASPMMGEGWYANFRGWLSYRKTLGQ